MTTTQQAVRASALAEELDHVNAALAAVQGGTFTVAIEILAPGSAAFRFTANPTQAALTTLLTNRQTVLQNALTTLGFTF